MSKKSKVGPPPLNDLKVDLLECWLLYDLDLRARNVRPGTLESAEYVCRKLITHFGESTDVNSITSNQLKSFYVMLNNNLSAQTVETIFRKTKTWFEYLVKEELLGENPYHKLKNVKLDRTVLPHLVQSEVEEIIHKISRPKTLFELRDSLLFYTALDTGLRLSEIAELKQSDLNLPQIIIRRGKMGKGRVVCVGRTTQKLFQRYLIHLSRVSSCPETIWISANGGKLTDSGIQVVFRRMSRRLGVKIHPHKIRRTSALQYLKAKVDLHTLRQLMGWSSFEMVQRYVAIDATLIEEAVLIASPVDKLSKSSCRKALGKGV
jgi:site-specific recombinase XerD